jgi:asparagine synthase (glutamine-hydrolysing)
MPFICLGNGGTSGSGDQTSFQLRTGSPTVSIGWWRIQCQLPTNILQTAIDQPIIVLDGYLTGTRSTSIVSEPSARSWQAQCQWVLDLVQRHGVRALGQLQGCFVIAVIDKAQDRLIMTRDLMGGRTAYWHQSEHGTLVASRSREVAARLPCGPEPDPSFVAACFATNHHYPIGASAFRQVHELLPGETIVFGRNKTERTRARLDLPETESLSPKQANRIFLEKVDSATRACLPIEQDCAAMVSGGLDSGPVAILADRALAAESRALKAVSWILPTVPESDESKWIRILGQALQSGVAEFDATNLLPFSEIGPSLVCADYPILNPYRAMKERCYQWAAEQDCPVILNGNAGDWIYPRRDWLYADTWRRLGTRVLAADLLWAIRNHGIRFLLRDPAFRGMARELPGSRTLVRLMRRRRKDRFPWLTDHANRHLSEPPHWPPETPPSHHPEYVHQLFGPRMIFGRAHEQCFSNRHGVERRDPFHDEELARFMLSLPYRASHFRDTSKNIMRVAMRGLLPDPLRTKGRTGLLNDALYAGLDANRSKLVDFLNRNDQWREYVHKEHLDRALARTSREYRDQHLICQCLGYSLWLKKLGLT